MKIIIYEPSVLFWGKATGFHGYVISFIKLYADSIYIKDYSFKRNIKYRLRLWQLGIRRPVKILSKLPVAEESVVIGFNIPASDDSELVKFKGKKYFHLMDYYIDVKRNLQFLKQHNVDYVIGHTKMDKYCPFFYDYYDTYIGKTIGLPFGYQGRFTCNVNFADRINKAVGLGSINPINDPLLKDTAKQELVDYFRDVEFMHPVRRYVQLHEEEFADTIDARFPSPEKQKDFSYDAVAMLNKYRMFINDAGISNFPPARTFEGIACGCVMVAEDSDIYKELGFVPDINYIAYAKGDYEQMKSKIAYYQLHYDKLFAMHVKSLELAQQFPHDKIAEKLYAYIIDNKGD